MTAGDGSMTQCWRLAVGSRSFRLYPERRQLWCGDARVSMGSRTFSLLVVLAENAGQVVTRAALLDRVWKTSVASETMISSQVSILRSKLGAEDCVVAVSSQGYTMTVPVERGAEAAPAPEAKPARLPISLPHPSATGIGRDAELAALTSYCGRHRLVTIVGPGGVGKTWLAVELGWELAESFPGGVHLVALGPVTERLAIIGAVAQKLGVPLRRATDPARLLASAIGRQRLLLIFDSCEYVVAPVRELVQEMLALAPNLTIVATSQEPLGLPKELIVPLGPLPPEEAEALFLQCVRAAGRRVPGNGRMAASVAEICRRLDGLPLALEMAAALVPALGIEGVRDGLGQQRFEMLDSRVRIGEPRQASLSAMVEWSHGLLDEADRKVFRRLGCFRGSFSREAAIAVAGDEGAKPWDVLAGLMRLVGKSLLVAEEGERPRYRLLETLGLYAAARLAESGEADIIAERHARFYVDRFEAADLAWETNSDADWVAAYGPDMDNLRAALDRALADPRRAPVAMSLAGAAGALWYHLGLNAEGQAYLDQLVDRADTEPPSADGARILKRAALLWRRVDRARFTVLLERSVALYRRLPDRLKLGAALALLGGAYLHGGRRDDAKAALDEARDLLAASNYRKSLQNAASSLATLTWEANDFEAARQYFSMARDLARSLNDKVREIIKLCNLAELEFHAGSVNQALDHVREAAASFQSLDQPGLRGAVLVNLASFLALLDRLEEAREHAAEALPLVRNEGGRWLRLCLQLWALLGARAGKYPAAAQVLGFVDAGFARAGEVRETTERLICDRLSELLTGNLSGDDIEAWADEGASWTEEHAAAFALRRLVGPED
jgi:predicted ATPase/DNA-binding winged helix-turn-helix (wHTH) protein